MGRGLNFKRPVPTAGPGARMPQLRQVRAIRAYQGFQTLTKALLFPEGMCIGTQTNVNFV